MLRHERNADFEIGARAQAANDYGFVDFGGEQVGAEIFETFAAGK